jgi:ATP-dependent helicase/nuclease subunit B
MRERGDQVLEWARSLDAVFIVEPTKRPHPSPPKDRRPKRLSVTRIETLIRDPYAIYARDVLKLRPFEPIGKLPDAAERGSLIHGILEDFVRERPRGPFDRAAEKRLIEIGRVAFDAHRDFPEVQALWWPRFEKIARWFVRIEAELGEAAERRVEKKGEWQITPDFLLTARADRLDALADGGVGIIDYKTGTPPSFKEMRALSPQLPLEALILRSGGFESIPASEPRRLIYYRLSGRDEGGLCRDLTFPTSKAQGEGGLDETLALTERRIGELVAYFERGDAEYISNKIPRPRRTYVGDYDHLARISEWVATDEEDEGNE